MSEQLSTQNQEEIKNIAKQIEDVTIEEKQNAETKDNQDLNTKENSEQNSTLSKSIDFPSNKNNEEGASDMFDDIVVNSSNKQNKKDSMLDDLDFICGVADELNEKANEMTEKQEEQPNDQDTQQK